VNTATANLERDVANGKETREFLGQSMGFENELIGQTNVPPTPTQRSCPRLFFPCRAGFPEDGPETVRKPPPPRRNMPSTERLRQGGKLGGKLGMGATLVESGKPSLSLSHPQARAFTKNSPIRAHDGSDRRE
jgi:hypothetical protein